MATGAHGIHQRREQVERRLRSLTNPDLKAICKDHGQLVSGTKAILLKRCLDDMGNPSITQLTGCATVLDDIMRKGSAREFEDFRYRVENNGRAPPPSMSSPARSQHIYQSVFSSSHEPGAQRQAGGTQSISKALGSVPVKFRANPFYEVQSTVLGLRELQEQPQTRHTDRCIIKLTEDVAALLKNDSTMRLMIYCASAGNIAPYYPCDITFPNSIEVKLNGETLKHNFKGLKNKPGSTKPADITGLIRKAGNYENQLEVTYALTTKRFAFLVYLVRYVSADILTERIRSRQVISKERVLKEMGKANADPDIAATSTVMSLKDPVSIMRMRLPIRSTVCTHNQCFDGSMFMQLQEQGPTWTCPVCNKGVVFESLAVDKYVEEILQKTSTATEKVTIEPDGEWHVAKVDEEEEQKAAGRRRPKASYDQDDDDDDEDEDEDDDDDDLVDITDGPPSKSQLNGVASHAAAVQHSTALSKTGNSATSFQTPPLSSREPSVAQSGTSAPPTNRPNNKRASSAIIDLTLSDEDEPPRPAKRTATGTNVAPILTQQGISAVPYRSPASLPDRHSASNGHHHHHHRQPSYSNANGNADSFRPSSSTSSFGGVSKPGRWPPLAQPRGPGHPPPAPMYARPSSQTPQSPLPGQGFGQYARTSPGNGTGWPPSLSQQSQQQHSRPTSQHSYSIRQSSIDPSHGSLPSPGPAGPIGGHGSSSSSVPPDLATASTSRQTDSAFRLPPMQIHPLDDSWNAQWRSGGGSDSDRNRPYSNSPI
ncbi:hypothetical protein K431DRAFT_295021 [Polychaeton citri CBS 116435]|uniref:PINIT domain-containing protein n=1 Tax=Polychaeton citri CBS 116435 TaxID=1314669 RepID=A0A9P4Q8S6_9PEZI|nr:hypothetical protein K431DRAFT_295021 [Polychaeton citri CBS 116435]